VTRLAREADLDPEQARAAAAVASADPPTKKAADVAAQELGVPTDSGCVS